MAGDWIKFEHATCDKPEVVKMATTLRIDQDSVVGKLLRVWVWADLNSVDGNTVGITEAFIDRMTCKRGFARAMRDAGWLHGEDGSLTFHNFGRHNGASAKARGEENRKKKTRRERLADHAQTTIAEPDKTHDLLHKSHAINTACPDFVPPNVPQSPGQKQGPEKRREEKSISNLAEAEKSAPRKRDVLFDALAIAEGSEPAQLTAPAAKKIGVALAQIRKIAPNVAPSEIQERAKAYKRLYPTAALTAHALAMHWAKCGSHQVRPQHAPIAEPDGWRVHLKDHHAGESWADTAGLRTWEENPRNWQERITREMNKTNIAA